MSQTNWSMNMHLQYEHSANTYAHTHESSVHILSDYYIAVRFDTLRMNTILLWKMNINLHRVKMLTLLSPKVILRWCTWRHLTSNDKFPNKIKRNDTWIIFGIISEIFHLKQLIIHRWTVTPDNKPISLPFSLPFMMSQMLTQ